MKSSTSLRLKIWYNVIVLGGLFFLDIRDFVYKTQWIGPFNDYAFSVTSLDGFHAQPMQLAQPLCHPSPIKDDDVDGDGDGNFLLVAPRPSGFASFLNVCDNMTAVSNDPAFVLQFVGQNCRFGPPKSSDPSRRYRTPAVFLDTSMRVDAVTWGCCLLVFPKRRPEICQTSMVSSFLTRYNLALPAVDYDWMVKPNSAAEAELLALLDVVDLSWPMDLVVCSAGFEFDFKNQPIGEYDFTVFGCASPNQNAAALVGHFAPQIHQMIGNLQWLTADDLNLLGYHFVVRENCRAMAQITQEDPNDRRTLRLRHTEIVNFSSFGTLYHLMLVMDGILLMVHMATAIELLQHLILPFLRAQVTCVEVSIFLHQDYAGFFARSLYRSPPILCITLVTELLSWMTILPASTIWTWSHSEYAKLQSFLTTMRLWTLLLIVVNTWWDLIVTLHERVAYEMARRTFLTPSEMIVVGLLTCLQHRTRLFGIGDAKYRLEHQRVVDFGTFIHAETGNPMVVFANTFNEQLDALVCTSFEVLWTIYAPLVIVVAQSVTLLVALAGLKMLLGHHFCFRPFTKRSIQAVTKSRVVPTTASSPVVSMPWAPKRSGGQVCRTSSSSRHPPVGSQPNLKNGPCGTLGRKLLGVILGCPSKNDSAIAARTFLANYTYKRLPLENLLQTPIRARSLVRDSLEMEMMVDNQLHLPPCLYFDFGIFVCNGLVKTRRGFVGVVEAKINVQPYTNDPAAMEQCVSTNVPL